MTLFTPGPRNADVMLEPLGRASLATGFRVVAAGIRHITQPDRTPMTAAKAFGWALVTSIAIGLFLFAAAVTG